MLWWSPDPRMVLFVDEFRMWRSLPSAWSGAVRDPRRHRLRAVIEACAGAATRAARHVDHARDHRGLSRLHAPRLRALGGSLARRRARGGLYGLALGRVFFGESMFARAAGRVEGRAGALVAMLRNLACR